jgi:hypothetical protein
MTPILNQSAIFVGVVGFLNVKKILPNPPLAKEGLRKKFILKNSSFYKGGDRGIWQIYAPYRPDIIFYLEIVKC